MPVKPNSNSSHLQLVMTNGVKFNQTLTVLFKNSNILVQPTISPDLHITLHSNEGSERRKNSHFRIEDSSVRHFDIESNQKNSIRNGILAEWNRDISPNYNCPLELIFPSCFALDEKAPIIPEYKTQIINYRKGALYLNFWFTKHDKKQLENYWNLSGLKILMFEEIAKNNENFALTYHVINDDNRFKSIEKVKDYFELSINKKGDKTLNSQKINFTFGLSPKNKKTIIFY